MMEKNRATLRKAIEQLPVYSPADESWEKLSERLDSGEDTLAEGLHKLPAYSPPPAVWNAISHSLENGPATTKTIRLKVRHWMSIAAGVTLLLFAALWLQQEPAPKVALTYSEETIVPIEISINWDEEEPQFEMLLQQLEQLESPKPSLNKLRIELEELNAAKNEVKVMLAAYGGRDPKLITQLGDIERERSAVYRELIKQI